MAVIFAIVKKDERILVWGILAVLSIIIGYVRNKNIHEDMKNAENTVWEAEDSEDNSGSLIIRGTVYDVAVKQNSIYYYLENVYVFKGNKSDTYMSDIKREMNIGRAVLICRKDTYKEYSDSRDFDKEYSYKYMAGACAGQFLCAEVKAYAFSVARNDGGFDEAKYYHSQKIWSGFKTDSQDNITIIKNHNIIGRYKNILYRLKNHMEVCLEKICGSRYIGLYKGILLGDKEDIDSGQKELYRLAGISHILAISGLHISLIGYFVYRKMRKISGYMIAGIITLTVVISYGVMIGGTASVQRAVLMFAIHIVGDIMGRSYDVLSSMSMALLIMLMDNPMCVDNSGAVLSFTAILGITVVYDNVKGFLRLKNKLMETIVASECINVVTRPIIAMSYYEISLYSTVINIIVIPLMSVVAGCGFIGIILSNIHTGLAKIFIYPGCMILKLYDFICRKIIKLPYAVKITGIPDNGKMLLYYLIIACGIWIIRRKNTFDRQEDIRKEDIRKENIRKTDTGKHYNIRAGCVGIVMAVLLILIIYRKNDILKIQMLDVGQGDCICINNGSEVILTDGGSSSSKDIGSYTIMPFLKANGVEKVDYLMVSHSDADHINGLVTLMEYKYNGENYVKNLIMPKISDDVKDVEYRNIAEKAEQEGINVLYFGKDSGIDFSGMSIKCISPDRNMSGDKNELSMVYYLKSKNITMIFTGDMGSEGEERLLKNNLIHDVDILKVGHHGSNGSCTEDFLNKLEPEAGIISCGINNSYGHPGTEALNRLYDAGADVYITAQSGQIDIVECKNGFKVETFLH